MACYTQVALATYKAKLFFSRTRRSPSKRAHSYSRFNHLDLSKKKMTIRSRWFTSVYSSRFRVLTVAQLDSYAPPGWASVTVLNGRVLIREGPRACRLSLGLFGPVAHYCISHPVELGLTKPFRRKHKSAVVRPFSPPPAHPHKAAGPVSFSSPPSLSHPKVESAEKG